MDKVFVTNQTLFVHVIKWILFSENFYKIVGEMRRR